ncbi:hypothetical protein [Qipengyuania qiaonensis]|uniref:Uncharacterized protein n=1 Tax=Qipengyuania qiaonensis TaxID=2867240 RepID=A0ABS7J794_9SPHN|nr:hypothetical protein [Qipengyuania qiaonensis]MBX7483189.1 hypothetical protein [Qipengyuania qiaonensis]
MDTSPRIPWYEELDEFLTRCEEPPAPTGDHSHAMVLQLFDLLHQAPDSMRQHFEPPADAVAKPLFESRALEQILLLTTERVGTMTSRSQSGYAIATVALPELGIEKTFSSENCLALAMTGAIAAAALAIIADEPYQRFVGN